MDLYTPPLCSSDDIPSIPDLGKIASIIHEIRGLVPEKPLSLDELPGNPKKFVSIYSTELQQCGLLRLHTGFSKTVTYEQVASMAQYGSKYKLQTDSGMRLRVGSDGHLEVFFEEGEYKAGFNPVPFSLKGFKHYGFTQQGATNDYGTHIPFNMVNISNDCLHPINAECLDEKYQQLVAEWDVAVNTHKQSLRKYYHDLEKCREFAQSKGEEIHLPLIMESIANLEGYETLLVSIINNAHNAEMYELALSLIRLKSNRLNPNFIPTLVRNVLHNPFLLNDDKTFICSYINDKLEGVSEGDSMLFWLAEFNEDGIIFPDIWDMLSKKARTLGMQAVQFKTYLLPQIGDLIIKQ